MNIELPDLNKIKLFNIVDMGLSFSAMMRLYEKQSKERMRGKILQLLDKIYLSESRRQFDEYHEQFCKWGAQNIVLAKKVRNNRITKTKGPASYGQIAKTLDVVLKVVIHYCHWPTPLKSENISEWLHAAIDNKMMNFLRSIYPKFFENWPRNVEAVDKGKYKKLQELVKAFIQEEYDGKIIPVNFDDIYWNILNRAQELSQASNHKKVAKQIKHSSKRQKLHTRGGPGKRIHFEWWFDEKLKELKIESKKGRHHSFSLDEILSVIITIKNEFGSGSFPLANNVAKLGKGTEVRGLGTIILDQSPGDVTHAQGSSYLGPVLEHMGYFEWNGKHKGIEWSLKDLNIDIKDLTHRLTERL